MTKNKKQPSEQELIGLMKPSVPYVVSDFIDEYPDTSRWTIQRRLESLLEKGEINKKKHSKNTVTWWRPED